MFKNRNRHIYKVILSSDLNLTVNNAFYWGDFCRNHQGLDNCIPFPDSSIGTSEGKIRRNERLAGLLKYYYRKAT